MKQWNHNKAKTEFCFLQDKSFPISLYLLMRLEVKQPRKKTKKKRNNKREFCIIIIWVAKLFEHFSSLRTFFYSCLEAIILCNFWMTSKDPHETMINLGKRHQTWPRYHFSYLLYPPAWWPRLHGCWYSKVVSDVALVRVWPLNQEMLVTYLFQLFVNLLSNCLQFTLGEWSII